jgi:DNA-binding XRE family transcriptional regulator
MSQIDAFSKPVQESLQMLGNLIQSARKAAKYTAKELAQRAGVNRKTITRLERGDPGIGLGLFITVLWLLDIPLLRGIDIGNRQNRTQIALLLRSLNQNQIQRVRHTTKSPYDKF